LGNCFSRLFSVVNRIATYQLVEGWYTYLAKVFRKQRLSMIGITVAQGRRKGIEQLEPGQGELCSMGGRGPYFTKTSAK